MKQFLTFLTILCSYLLCGAQATTLTVDNKVAGTLSQRILYDDKLTIENLILSGEINATDISFIKELNSKYNLHGILDIKDVSIVAGGTIYSGGKNTSTSANSFNCGMFNTSKRLHKLIVPSSITKWDEGKFTSDNGSAGYSTHYGYLNTDSLIVECEDLKTISNGIGNPSYIYLKDGIETFSIASKEMDALPGATDGTYCKAPDSLCIYLPQSISALYGHKRMGSPKITIHSKIYRPDNIATGSNKWADDVLTNGIIYAPYNTKQYYESSIFKNLKIIAPVSVLKITLSETTTTIGVGDSKKLEAIISPSNADNQKILWKSSDEKIAIADSCGNVTAIW